MPHPTSLPTSLPSAIPHFQVGGFLDRFQLPHHWPTTGDLLVFCNQMGPGEAALFIIFGVVFLLFGINIYKFLVMLNVALFAAAVGGYLGDKGGNQAVGAVTGGFVGAALSWPLMKHAVSLLGAAVGGVLGASIWRVAELPPDLVWAGAMCGAIAFGMLSFVLFRGCIMMYTSLQGSVMITIGVLSLIYKYPDLAPRLTATMSAKNYILPVAVLMPALFGLIYQQTPAAKPPPPKK